MTEVSNEFDEYFDRAGQGVPEAVNGADPIEPSPIELSGGTSRSLTTDSLKSFDPVEIGELVDTGKPHDTEIEEDGDDDLLLEASADRQDPTVANARAQVADALDTTGPDTATDGNGRGGPEDPKLPTRGRGEDGDPEDDRPDNEDSEEDLRWVRDHAHELELLDRALQSHQAQHVPATTEAAADEEDQQNSVIQRKTIHESLTEPIEDDKENSGDFPKNDETDESEVAEVKGETERPTWVETRSLKDIAALRDQTQFSNEDLALMWKDGDPEAAGAFLTRNSGFFHTITMRNLRTDEHRDYDDVRQQYELLFLKALQNYDPDRGAKALSYAGAIAEAQLADGREPSRDSVGAQPGIRQVERKIFALNRLLEGSGGYEPLTDAQIGKYKLNDDQLAAVRQVEARVQANGFSPLTDAEVLAIFHTPGADSSSPRYISASKLTTIRQHTALTDRLLSSDHSAPEYSVWLGNNTGILSDNELTSHVRPVLEVPQVSVDELVAEKVTNEGLRDILPRALETLDEREREILYLHTVEGLSQEAAAQRYSESHEPISRERLRQIHAGIVDSTRYGSARGALFRHMIASATGYEEPRRLHGPSTESVLRARQAMASFLPMISERSRSILNGYFILDGRDAAEGESLHTLAEQHGLRYADVNRIVNRYVATVAGDLDVGQMRQHMLHFAPIGHPLNDDERRKWGLVS